MPIGQYKLVQELGKGKQSVVYKARKKGTLSFFAVKSLTKDRKAFLQNELEIIKDLSHPNICSVFELCETTNHLWVISDLCMCGDLLGILKQDQRLPEVTIRLMGQDMLEGLQFLHHNGIIHCNLKPSNILIDSCGTVKFTDFSLSKHISECTEELTQNLKEASPCYLAPELLEGFGVFSYASDLWALGCIFYELRTGRPPFFSISFVEIAAKVINSELIPIPGASTQLMNLINRLLIKDPSKRMDWNELSTNVFFPNPHAPLYLPQHNAFIESIKRKTGQPGTLPEERLSPSVTPPKFENENVLIESVCMNSTTTPTSPTKIPKPNILSTETQRMATDFLRPPSSGMNGPSNFLRMSHLGGMGSQIFPNGLPDMLLANYNDQIEFCGQQIEDDGNQIKEDEISLIADTDELRQSGSTKLPTTVPSSPSGRTKSIISSGSSSKSLHGKRKELSEGVTSKIQKQYVVVSHRLPITEVPLKHVEHRKRIPSADPNVLYSESSHKPVNTRHSRSSSVITETSTTTDKLRTSCSSISSNITPTFAFGFGSGSGSGSGSASASPSSIPIPIPISIPSLIPSSTSVPITMPLANQKSTSTSAPSSMAIGESLKHRSQSSSSFSSPKQVAPILKVLSQPSITRPSKIPVFKSRLSPISSLEEEKSLRTEAGHPVPTFSISKVPEHRPMSVAKQQSVLRLSTIDITQEQPHLSITSSTTNKNTVTGVNVNMTEGRFITNAWKHSVSGIQKSSSMIVSIEENTTIETNLNVILFHQSDCFVKAIVGHKPQLCDSKELNFMPLPISELLNLEFSARDVLIRQMYTCLSGKSSLVQRLNSLSYFSNICSSRRCGALFRHENWRMLCAMLVRTLRTTSSAKLRGRIAHALGLLIRNTPEQYFYVHIAAGGCAGLTSALNDSSAAVRRIAIAAFGELCTYVAFSADSPATILHDLSSSPWPQAEPACSLFCKAVISEDTIAAHAAARSIENILAYSSRFSREFAHQSVIEILLNVFNNKNESLAFRATCLNAVGRAVRLSPFFVVFVISTLSTESFCFCFGSSIRTLQQAALNLLNIGLTKVALKLLPKHQSEEIEKKLCNKEIFMSLLSLLGETETAIKGKTYIAFGLLIMTNPLLINLDEQSALTQRKEVDQYIFQCDQFLLRSLGNSVPDLCKIAQETVARTKVSDETNFRKHLLISSEILSALLLLLRSQTLKAIVLDKKLVSTLNLFLNEYVDKIGDDLLLEHDSETTKIKLEFVASLIATLESILFSSFLTTHSEFILNLLIIPSISIFFPRFPAETQLFALRWIGNSLELIMTSPQNKQNKTTKTLLAQVIAKFFSFSAVLTTDHVISSFYMKILSLSTRHFSHFLNVMFNGSIEMESPRSMINPSPRSFGVGLSPRTLPSPKKKTGSVLSHVSPRTISAHTFSSPTVFSLLPTTINLITKRNYHAAKFLLRFVNLLSESEQFSKNISLLYTFDIIPSLITVIKKQSKNDDYVVEPALSIAITLILLDKTQKHFQEHKQFLLVLRNLIELMNSDEELIPKLAAKLFMILYQVFNEQSDGFSSEFICGQLKEENSPLSLKVLLKISANALNETSLTTLGNDLSTNPTFLQIVRRIEEENEFDVQNAAREVLQLLSR